MSGARTERPTPRRLREARRRGEVAVSRDATGLGALLGGGAAAAALAPATLARLAAGVRAAASGPAGEELRPSAALARAGALLAATAAPVLLAAAAGALGAGLLQTRGLLAPAAVAPDAARLHPARNLRRVASADAAAALALAAAKAAAGLAVACSAARAAAPDAAGLPRLAPGALLGAIPRLLAPGVLGLLALAAALAAADVALARRRHHRALRMTREEVLREQREDEGDPRHRAARRGRHRALVDAPPVSRATCVVVNPSHLAVALLHDRASEAAPLVVAKGAGRDAARIRAEARRAGVPVVRDVPLARALWRLAEVGDEIPEPLYEAAAAILVHVHGLAPAGAR